MSAKRSLSLVLITTTVALAFLSRVPSLFAAPQSSATNSVQPSPPAFNAAEFASAIRQVAVAAMPDNDFQSIHTDYASSLGHFTVTLPGFKSCYPEPDPKRGDPSDKTIAYVCARFFLNQNDSDAFYSAVVANVDDAVGNGQFRPASHEDVWKATSVESSLTALVVGVLHHKCYGIDPTHFIVKVTESHDLIKLNKKDPNDYSVVLYIHQKHAALGSCR